MSVVIIYDGVILIFSVFDNWFTVDQALFNVFLEHDAMHVPLSDKKTEGLIKWVEFDGYGVLLIVG